MVQTVIAFFLTLLATFTPAASALSFALEPADAFDSCCCCQTEDVSGVSKAAKADCAELNAQGIAFRGRCCAIAPVEPAAPPPPIERYQSFFYPVPAVASLGALSFERALNCRQRSSARAFHLASNKLYLQTRVLLI